MNNPPLSLYIELNIFASPFNEDKVYISSQRKHAPLWPYYKKTYFIVFTKVSWDIHLLWYYKTFVSKVIYKKICFVTFWLLIFALRKRKTSFLVYLKSSNNSFLVLDLFNRYGHVKSFYKSFCNIFINNLLNIQVFDSWRLWYQHITVPVAYVTEIRFFLQKDNIVYVSKHIL